MKKTNNNSPMKRIAASATMLAVSAAMLGTSTYAWFTMNKEVTVTGMEVKTKVGDNLLIAQDTLGSTAKVTDANFKTSDVDIMAALLEPVSTVNGTTFYYTDSFNVAGNGDALSDTYTLYSEATNESPDTLSKKTYYDSAFQVNYGNDGSVTADNVAYGYIDYVFQLKANNTTTSAKDVVVKSINLTSGKAGDSDSLHAFRAAIFSQDITSTTPTANDPGTLVTILSNEGATTGDSYFTTKSAISTNGAPTTVNNYNVGATIGSAGQSATTYYKVVVRLWIEGEDTKCTNTVFNTINDQWALSLDIVMDGTTSATTTLTTSAPTAKADISAATLATGEGATVVIDGVTYTKIDSVQLGGADLYVGGTTLTASSKIYTISATSHPTDVTNQCKLPTT